MNEPPSQRRLPRSALIGAIAAIAALYLAQGFYYARVLVPTEDAIQYLLIGAKAVKGEIGLYDDRIVGNRLPLPFYVLGLTQAIAGPSLRAARWLNVGLGLLTLLLAAALARRLSGDVAGILAALFLTTQGVIVGYYSYEGYLAFAALCVISGLSVFGDGASPVRRVLGTALLGLLFFVRSNLWPIIPLALGYSLWRAKRLAERLLLVAVVLVPPLVFFAWDQTHLKLLAYVPVARRFVAPLGYVSALVIDDRQILSPAAQVWELVRVVRRYEFWALAAALLAVILVWHAATGRRLQWATGRIRALAALLAISIASLFVMYPWNYRWIGFYFVPYAPVAAVLLGVGYGALWAETRPRSWRRRLLILVLFCVLAPPLYFVRNPLLPTGDLLAKDPYAAAYKAAAHLRRAVPGNPKVFFYGLNEVYYLSGLPHTYLQTIYAFDPFPRVPVDDRVAQRSGFVTRNEVRHWLSSDADYAVIDMKLVEQMTPKFGETEREMLDLVPRHFELIDTVNEFPYSIYLVYRRKDRPAPRQAAAARAMPNEQSAEGIHPR
jgi:hypothetical protein